MNQPSKKDQREAKLNALWAEYLRDTGPEAATDWQAFLQRHEEFAEELRELVGTADPADSLAGPGPLLAKRSAEPSFTSDLPATVHYQGSTRLTSGDAARVTAGTPPHAGAPAQELDWLARTWNSSGGPIRFGEYELIEPLGRGGMGVVYKARQLAMNRTVAIKMILAGRFASKADVERFRREAWAAGSLSHPHIVSIYEIGEVDGHDFFSMEYIEGRTLADVARDGALTPQRAARYLEIIARAVGHAHQHGILHRDLKPANVLLDGDDQPHISDFGLAKSLSDEGLTSSGTTLGTPAYMSPEQAAGMKEGIGPATDIYSLGAILYQLLTDRPPFQGNSVVGIMLDVLHREPPPPRRLNPQVDRVLETICLKCLHKNPAERYASAFELADDLRRFLDGQPVAAKSMGRLRRTGLWLSGVPVVAAVLGRRFVHSTKAQKRLQWGVFACLLLSGVWLAFALTRETPLPRQIVIAGGLSGGVYDRLADQLAASLHRETGNPVAVLETGGSLANRRLLANTEAHLALLQADALPAGELVVAAPLYYEVMHLAIRKRTQQQSSIDSLADLASVQKSLRIAMGSLDSGSHDTAVRILKTLGLESERLVDSRAAFADLLTDPTLDLGVLITGPENESLQRVMRSGEFRLLAIENPGPVALRSPGLLPLNMQPADYPFVAPEDFPAAGIPTLAVPAFLAVRHDASPRLVRAALGVLYEDDQLMRSFQLIPAEAAIRWSALPWHPAARAFLEAERSGSSP